MSDGFNLTSCWLHFMRRVRATTWDSSHHLTSSSYHLLAVYQMRSWVSAFPLIWNTARWWSVDSSVSLLIQVNRFDKTFPNSTPSSDPYGSLISCVFCVLSWCPARKESLFTQMSKNNKPWSELSCFSMSLSSRFLKKGTKYCSVNLCKVFTLSRWTHLIPEPRKTLDVNPTSQSLIWDLAPSSKEVHFHVQTASIVGYQDPWHKMLHYRHSTLTLTLFVSWGSRSFRWLNWIGLFMQGL